jgi:Arc/MetJ family transcription regulator
MRTNIVIDDELMRAAMQASGLETKRAVVEAGLKLLLDVKGQAAIRRLRGKVAWDGDLKAARASRARAV